MRRERLSRALEAPYPVPGSAAPCAAARSGRYPCAADGAPFLPWRKP